MLLDSKGSGSEKAIKGTTLDCWVEADRPAVSFGMEGNVPADGPVPDWLADRDRSWIKVVSCSWARRVSVVGSSWKRLSREFLAGSTNSAVWNGSCSSLLGSTGRWRAFWSIRWGSTAGCGTGSFCRCWTVNWVGRGGGVGRGSTDCWDCCRWLNCWTGWTGRSTGRCISCWSNLWGSISCWAASGLWLSWGSRCDSIDCWTGWAVRWVTCCCCKLWGLIGCWAGWITCWNLFGSIKCWAGWISGSWNLTGRWDFNGCWTNCSGCCWGNTENRWDSAVCWPASTGRSIGDWVFCCITWAIFWVWDGRGGFVGLGGDRWDSTGPAGGNCRCAWDSTKPLAPWGNLSASAVRRTDCKLDWANLCASENCCCDVSSNRRTGCCCCWAIHECSSNCDGAGRWGIGRVWEIELTWSNWAKRLDSTGRLGANPGGICSGMGFWSNILGWYSW